MARLNDSYQLVRTNQAGDVRERVSEVVGDGVGGGDELLACADLNGAVAAGGAHEAADRPAGAVLDELAHGERGEHDREARVDGLALVVVDRAGGEVVLGHPERGLYLEDPVVGA